jgi:RNA polymerase sigma factor (sigma-70 family)
MGAMGVGGGPARKPLRSFDTSSQRASPGVPAVAYAASFEDFFELENEALFGALYLLSGNRSDAEDLMQLAFLKVWERWSVVQEMDNPTGYLYRTAMNRFRSERRRAAVAARRAYRHVRGSDAMDRVDAQDEVDRALATLTPRQREAVVLVDLLQFPADEAARLLNMAPSTLRVHLARGRERARNELGGVDG